MGLSIIAAAIFSIAVAVKLIILHVKIYLNRKNMTKKQLVYTYKTTVIWLPIYVMLFFLLFILLDMSIGHVLNL